MGKEFNLRHYLNSSEEERKEHRLILKAVIIDNRLDKQGFSRARQLKEAENIYNENPTPYDINIYTEEKLELMKSRRDAYDSKKVEGGYEAQA